MADDKGIELGWDSTIKDDGPEFIVLPKGRYPFEVISLEKTRFSGSENLSPCYQAIVHLKFFGKDKDTGKDGITTIKHSLFLNSRTKDYLCAFFIAIGQLKKGEEIAMNWNKVVGSKGEAELYVDKWTSKEGKEMENNKVQKFCGPVEKAFEAGRF